MDREKHERWWREHGARELRELLFHDWDPIGLNRIAGAASADEYEHYAGQLVRKLRAGASEDDLVEALERYRADMGLEPSAEPPREVARKLHAWYARSLAERSA